MDMDYPKADYNPLNNQNVFLLVSNGALVVFAVAFIWFSLAFYREKGSEISFSESYFVTTEWNLMQTLKLNTDRQLMNKEQEILGLRQRYLQLLQNPESSQGAMELRNQLRRAEDERRDILSLRLAPPGQANPADLEAVIAAAPDMSAAAPRSPQSSSASMMFQSRIEMLETQLADEKALSSAISDTLAALSKERELSSRAFMEELALRDATIARISAAGSSAFDAIRRDSQNLEARRQAIELDLNTKVLLRAIASSPEIRARYPDLLASLDRYFDQLALVERLRGRAETYAATSKALEALQKELNLE